MASGEARALSDEVILSILSRLTLRDQVVCSALNRQWHRLRWRLTDLTASFTMAEILASDVMFDQLRAIKLNGGCIKRLVLHLRKSPLIDGVVIMEWLLLIQETLEVLILKIDDTTSLFRNLWRYLGCCYKLRKLRVHGLVWPADLQLVVNTCPSLTSLIIERCKSDPVHISHKNLVKLRIGNVSRLHLDTPKLARLQLYSCEHNAGLAGVSYLTLQSHSLSRISFMDGGTTDVTMQDFTNESRKITSLKWRGEACRFLVPQTLIQDVEELELARSSISHLRTKASCKILEAATSVQRITFGRRFLEMMLDPCEADKDSLRKLVSLREVHVVDYFSSGGLHILKALLESCPSLQELRITCTGGSTGNVPSRAAEISELQAEFPGRIKWRYDDSQCWN